MVLLLLSNWAVGAGKPDTETEPLTLALQSLADASIMVTVLLPTGIAKLNTMGDVLEACSACGTPLITGVNRNGARPPEKLTEKEVV